MSADHGRLLRLAEAVADEAPVDWEQEGTVAPAAQRLRQIAAMAEVHRAVGSELDGRAGLFRWGQLVAVERLAAGSCGEVYRAWDPMLEREVALKLRRTDPAAGGDDAGRLVDEARRLARLRHPNVLDVYGADLHAGRVGVWTELVEGRDLKQRLAEEGALPAGEAVRIGSALCAALGAVHAAGLVHGDVKAANVICGQDGRVVLGDFGSAVEAASGCLPTASPATAAPEVLRGDTATPAADIYSLGALLHQLVSGRLPFAADTVEGLMAAQSRRRRRSLGTLCPGLPASLLAAIERALDPEPARRFASAHEMGRALAAAQAEADEPGAPLQAPGRGRGALALVAVAAGVGALVLAATAVRRAAVPAPSPPAVSAALYRGEGARATALADGDAVVPGDLLHLGLVTEETVWAYVVNGDDHGDVFLLYPLPGVEPSNPLPPGTHRLPGRLQGVSQEWRVTSAGGTERFLVVVARQRLDDLELMLAGVRAAAREAGAAAAGDTLRGVGGLADAPLSAPRPGALDGIEAALLRRPSAHELWIGRFALRSGASADR